MKLVYFACICSILCLTSNGQSMYGTPYLGLRYNPYTSPVFGYGLGPQYSTIEGTLASSYLPQPYGIYTPYIGHPGFGGYGVGGMGPYSGYAAYGTKGYSRDSMAGAGYVPEYVSKYQPSSNSGKNLYDYQKS